MMLLRNHFRQHRTGLDAVLDEVEDLVRRNAQEFEAEVATLFQQVWPQPYGMSLSHSLRAWLCSPVAS